MTTKEFNPSDWLPEQTNSNPEPVTTSVVEGRMVYPQNKMTNETSKIERLLFAFGTRRRKSR